MNNAYTLPEKYLTYKKGLTSAEEILYEACVSCLEACPAFMGYAAAMTGSALNVTIDSDFQD